MADISSLKQKIDHMIKDCPLWEIDCKKKSWKGQFYDTKKKGSWKAMMADREPSFDEETDDFYNKTTNRD